MIRPHPLLVVAAGLTLLSVPVIRPERPAASPGSAGRRATVRDSITVMAPGRWHVDGMSWDGHRVHVPESWFIMIRVRSRSPAVSLVLALSASESRLPFRLSPEAVTQSLGGGSGPKRAIGESAYLDSLGCRFYAVEARVEQNPRPDRFGIYDLIGIVTIDSVTIRTHSRLTAFDAGGNRATSLPLEVR